MKNGFSILSMLLALLCVMPHSQAFTPTRLGLNSYSSEPRSANAVRSETRLHGLFGNVFGNKKEEKDPSLPTRIMDIQCNSVKSGGLRFALGLFLIGQQGTPVKGSWKANQASDGVLDMYYVDNTAMFSVHITDKLVYIDRYGRPSLQYQLQESLILHRFLDEINTLAFEGEDITDENRLIVLSDPENVIQNARDKLPARSAQ